MITIFLSKNIKYIRKLHRYSQEDFAERIKISKKTLSRYENAVNIHSLPLSCLLDICSLAKVTLDELIFTDMERWHRQTGAAQDDTTK